MSAVGPNSYKTFKWPFGFESGYPAQYAWQHNLSNELGLNEQKLELNEQIEIGVRLCIEKEKNSINLADTLRNSYEPTRYVLEKPFRELFKESAKDLCQELINLNDISEIEVSERQKKITDKIKNTIPEIFIENMTHFYRVHMQKRARNESDQVAKEEFVKLITFQFVNAAILNDVKNDPDNLIKVSKQLNRLPGHESYKEITKDLIQKLDNNDKQLPPLPDISLDLKTRFEEYLDFCKKETKILEKSNGNVKLKLEEKYHHITSTLENHKLDQEKYTELYEIRKKITKILDRVSNNFNINELKEIHEKSNLYAQKFFDETLKIAVAENDIDLSRKSLKMGANIEQKTTNYERNFFQRVKDVFTMKGGIRNFFVTPERDLMEVVKLFGNTPMNEFMNQEKNKLLNVQSTIKFDDLIKKEQREIIPAFEPNAKKYESTRKSPVRFSAQRKLSKDEMDKITRVLQHPHPPFIKQDNSKKIRK